MQFLLMLVGFFALVFFLVDGILKLTSWTDPKERRAAETFIFTSMLNDKTPKGK